LHRKHAHLLLFSILASLIVVTVYSKPACKVLEISLTDTITGATTQIIEDAIMVAYNMNASLIIITSNTPGGELPNISIYGFKDLSELQDKKE
jgi:membrane-bound ClpP family serine protease